MTVRVHVRQCDPSLPSDWHDDRPQQVGALLQNLLHVAFPLVVLLLHLDVALPQLRSSTHCTGHRSLYQPHLSHQGAIQAQITCLLTRNSSSSSFMVTNFACCCLSPTRCFFLQFSCPQIFDSESLPAADSMPRQTFGSIMAFQPALVTFDSFLSARLKSWQFQPMLIVCGLPSPSTRMDAIS